MIPRARLVCPALRWRRGSFRSERSKIEQALAAGVGGFILFGGTRAAVTALTSALRDTAGRPLLLGSDFERGPGQQVKGLTELPPPAALGYLNDLDATYACGQITGTEARAVGLNWVFAPVCDLDVEPKNPIVQTRSFGADPQLVGSHVAAWIRGCQEHSVMACAKHYPGHGRTTTDSHEGLPVVEALGDEVQRTDVAPFKAAVDAGVGSVMPAFVAYPRWDASGAAATFSPIVLGYLRDALGFRGLTVTDAFIMGGATAAAPEGAAAVAAVTAGCDMLLYPTDWAGVVRSLEEVPRDRAEQALERYEKTVREWGTGDAGRVDDAQLAEHQKFADGLADRAVHILRGDSPRLARSVSVSIVDDDVGGPYSIPPRDVFARTLADLGVRTTRYPIADSRDRLVLVYAEPRSWKGRADLGPQSIARLERLLPGASLVVLFAHPRLLAQVPGDVPVLSAWHGQALMQRAAARWVMRTA
ncbi:MAG TPA: glycoside hydrolase family 3 N-terminal domain-containing protein [Gemmatimonadales bacterium]|jgi:beta-glucosidase|nr:glycoside hydrolase family 3 N-terminal domain-containing protein [Gemmatimonadales bacterium]